MSYCIRHTRYKADVRRQTAVTAHLQSEQLLLFAVLQYTFTVNINLADQ